MNRKQFNRIVDLCLALRVALRDADGVPFDGSTFDSLHSIQGDAFERLTATVKPKPQPIPTYTPPRIYLYDHSWDGPLPNGIEIDLMSQGKKLDAIKSYRDRNIGCRLLCAKLAIEAYGVDCGYYPKSSCNTRWAIK